MRTAPEVYPNGPTAEAALWAMGNGKAENDHDRRYRVLALLTTFVSLRWGEATPLRRCDLAAGIVRVRLAYAERSTGGTGARPAEVESSSPHRRHPLIDHPRHARAPFAFVGPEADALIFPGVRGGPLRRSNFNKMAAWPYAVRAIGPKACTFTISGTPATTSRQPAARASRI